MPGGRGRLLVAVAVGLLLMVCGAVAWRTWGQVPAGPFDPVNAVIATAILAAGVAGAWAAVRALRQADADAVAVAGRLAVAVRRAEERERRHLLGGSDRVIDVRFRFRLAGQDAAGAAAAGTLGEVAGYYRRLRPPRLVITGAAGSGKTVLAIELILGLLEGREAEDPVPVRLSAAALDTAGPEEALVERWLAGQLERVYGLSRTAAASVVAARLVLPVLDGLDEMDLDEEPGYSSRAGQAIRACNAYLEGNGKAAMVLTCRVGQYRALAEAREWVRDAACVELLPVGSALARAFLARRAGDLARWQPVLGRIAQPGGELAAALATPWRLTVAAVVYEARDPGTGRYLRDPAELTSPAMASRDEVRDHLLGLFIPAAVQAHGGRYDEDQVRRWLTVLARYLNVNASGGDAGRVIAGRALSATDLILHELWPVAGRRAPRAVTAALMASICAGFAAWVLTRVPIGFSPRLIAGASGTVAGAGFAAYWASSAWPHPGLISARQLRTPRGLRNLAAGLVTGLAGGLAAGFALEIAAELFTGIAFGVAGGLAFWLASGLPVGLVIGFASDPGEYSATGPQEIVRANLIYGLVVGLVVGPIAGLVVGLAAGLAVGLAAGLAFGFALGLAYGLAGWRYIALLLCAWRPSGRCLPLRLVRFLNWCYVAGLIRIAGIGYQFRHRELQDYLARDATANLPAEPGHTGEAEDVAGVRNLLVALLSDQERALGPDHPHALTTRRNLEYWTRLGSAGRR